GGYARPRWAARGCGRNNRRASTWSGPWRNRRRRCRSARARRRRLGDGTNHWAWRWREAVPLGVLWTSLLWPCEHSFGEDREGPDSPQGSPDGAQRRVISLKETTYQTFFKPRARYFRMNPLQAGRRRGLAGSGLASPELGSRTQ